jgi:acyl dehydratase
MAVHALSPGYYWEDFYPGRHFTYGDYRLTQAEIIEFGKKYDPLPHHIDPDAAAASPLGTLCASGIQAVGIAHKMLCDNLFNNSALVAGRGFDTMRMHQPIPPDALLRVSMEVMQATPHKYQSDRGWVNFQVRLCDQHQHTVMTYASVILFLKRGAQAVAT